jgi:uncharacterized protein
MKTEYFVFDTNSLISAFLIQSSVSSRAFDKAISNGRLVMSQPCLDEFTEVLFRKKLDAYFSNEAERLEVIARVERNSVIVFPTIKIEACRDEKDNKFLELAVDAHAACVITGDKDLLVLHPFSGISIITPAEFLTNYVT